MAALITLRRQLALDYPTSSDCRRVADDAQLDTTVISFEAGQSLLRWHSMLKQASKQNCWQSLKAVLLGENPSLEELIANFDQEAGSTEEFEDLVFALGALATPDDLKSAADIQRQLFVPTMPPQALVEQSFSSDVPDLEHFDVLLAGKKTDDVNRGYNQYVAQKTRQLDELTADVDSATRNKKKNADEMESLLELAKPVRPVKPAATDENDAAQQQQRYERALSRFEREDREYDQSRTQLVELTASQSVLDNQIAKTQADIAVIETEMLHRDQQYKNELLIARDADAQTAMAEYQRYAEKQMNGTTDTQKIFNCMLASSAALDLFQGVVANPGVFTKMTEKQRRILASVDNPVEKNHVGIANPYLASVAYTNGLLQQLDMMKSDISTELKSLPETRLNEHLEKRAQLLEANLPKVPHYQDLLLPEAIRKAEVEIASNTEQLGKTIDTLTSELAAEPPELRDVLDAANNQTNELFAQIANLEQNDRELLKSSSYLWSLVYQSEDSVYLDERVASFCSQLSNEIESRHNYPLEDLVDGGGAINRELERSKQLVSEHALGRYYKQLQTYDVTISNGQSLLAEHKTAAVDIGKQTQRQADRISGGLKWPGIISLIPLLGIGGIVYSATKVYKMRNVLGSNDEHYKKLTMLSLLLLLVVVVVSAGWYFLAQQQQLPQFVVIGSLVAVVLSGLNFLAGLFFTIKQKFTK